SIRMIVFYLLIIATAWRKVAGANICSSSITISSQSDANNLRSCDSFEGSITISSSARGSITIHDVEEIKGGFIAQGSSALAEISAPDLTSVEGDITLRNLDSLTTLNMGALSQVHSLTITENPKLTSLGFQELEQVEGQLELTGSFSRVSLPALDTVKGRTVITGGGSMSCNALDSLKSDDVFEDSYTCSIASPSSGLSPGAKGGIAAAVILVVLLVMMILWLVLRRRRQRRSAGSAQSALSPSSATSRVEAREQKTLISQVSVSPQQRTLLPAVPPNALPRKPVGSAIHLDSRSLYEITEGSSPLQEYHELDAGPVSGSHQRPIHAD
ncbi:hypothetical protein N7461_003191, partial [Penicillium sp. DV-2018c]